MKKYYCANCGARLQVARKAVKNYDIIELVEYHICSEEVQEFDLSPVEMPTYVPEVGEKNKFVQKLNGLNTIEGQRNIPTLDLKDRRPTDQIKSDAPPSVLDQIKNMQPSEPVRDISEEPQE